MARPRQKLALAILAGLAMLAMIIAMAIFPANTHVYF